MHGSESFGAVMIVLIMFGGPIAWAITNRVLAFRERMEMIQRGMTPPLDPRTMRRMARNRWYAPGPVPGPMPGPMPGPAAAPPPPFDPNFATPQDWVAAASSPDRMLRKGVVLGFIGLALTIGLSFIGYQESGGPMGSSTIHPGPWLLGGLIPMFIGVAQVLLAVMSGANFRPGSGQYTQMPPPTYGTYQKPPIVDEPIAPPPWAGRPNYEELQRPAPPPDTRK